MKFKKFGKTLLMTALSAAVIFSVTSCVQSYTVGFLYVMGTKTSGTTGNGIISGFKIDHNTGNLVAIHGLPVASGGANPGRAVLITGGRFLYVLNRGANAAGTPDCTVADPCNGANIVEFAVGGGGILTQQAIFFPQGINPFRIFADASGNFLYTLDHDAPDSSTCSLALGSGVTSCGDISAFKIDGSTGRLSTVVNAQVTSASGSALPYFPVPANPIDFVLASTFILTLSGTSTAGDTAFPYSYSGSSGQLTVNQNSSQPLNIFKGTAINTAGGFVYVLDNEPLTVQAGDSSVKFPAGTYPSQILPFSVGTGGALQTQTGGSVPVAATQSNPIYLLQESKSKWVYVANQGNSTDPNNAQSGLTGYVIDPGTHQLTPMAGSPFGSGAGPQCLLEDPSDQFVYTANFNDSTLTGRVVDQNSGLLTNLPGKANRAFPLDGPAAWCLVTGRTS